MSKSHTFFIYHDINQNRFRVKDINGPFINIKRDKYYKIQSD